MPTGCPHTTPENLGDLCIFQQDFVVVVFWKASKKYFAMSDARGSGKQPGKFKLTTPKTAPGLSKKVTNVVAEEKQDEGGDKSEQGDRDGLENEDETVFICRGGSGKSCNREIKEGKSICCDVCSKWYHMSCQLKSAEEFDAISRFKMFWVCSYCRALIPTLVAHAGLSLADQVAGSLSELRDLLAEQARAVAGVASSNRDLCRVQEEVYNDLKQQFEEQASVIKACHLSCEEQTKQVAETVTRMEEKMKCRESQVEQTAAMEVEQRRSYAEVIKSLGTKIEEISAREVKVNTEAGSGEALVKSVGDFFDKERRKQNIVVHNLPESVDVDSKRRIEKDIEAFKSMVIDEFRMSVNIKQAFRAGKSEQERPRTLIVSLDDEGAKWDILKQAPHLRDSERYRGVFLSPDRTPEEREKDRNLRLEVKKLREEGKSVRIQRGKVVLLHPPPAGSGRAEGAAQGERSSV